MKALSVWPVWGGMIRARLKSLEIRSRRTHYRGPLVICSSKRPAYDAVPCGAALCIVDVVGCRPMTPGDEAAAGCAYAPGLWAWELENVRPLDPFPVVGRLGFFDVEVPAAPMRRRGRTPALQAV